MDQSNTSRDATREPPCDPGACRTEYNERMHAISAKPLRDRTSHAAYAIRYLALRLRRDEGPMEQFNLDVRGVV